MKLIDTFHSSKKYHKHTEHALKMTGESKKIVEHKSPVAVILLNWNACDQTLQCIRSLTSFQTAALDIFVVDNGSTDTSVSILAQQYPQLHILKNEKNLGYAGGNNVALKKLLRAEKTSYQYVLLLNTDAVIDESGLQALVCALDKHPDIGVIGPVFVKKNNGTQLLYAGGRDPAFHINTYRSAQFLENKKNDGHPVPVDYVSGTVALLRMATLEKSGLFYEGYFFSCEMADLCQQMKKQGVSCCITSEARAWHDMGQAGNRREALYLYYIIRNRFLYIRRCRRQFLMVLFPFWTGIGSLFIVKSLLKGKIPTARAIGLALRDGLLGRYGGRNALFTNLQEHDE